MYHVAPTALILAVTYSYLTWGRLFSRLSEMAPEPQPTSKHVCWDSELTPGPDFLCRSVSTSSTISCTKSIIKQNRFHDFWLRECCVCDVKPVSNLGFRSRYEHRRPHLQRQVSKVPLLDDVLHRHSAHHCGSILLNVHQMDLCTVIYCMWKFTLKVVWCRAATPAQSFLCWGTHLTSPAWDFPSG